MPRRERRRHSRYNIQTGNSGSRLKAAKDGVKIQVVNISRGGIQVRSRSKVPLDQVLKCELLLDGVPVPIPTLVQVQWCRGMWPTYYSGLRFVI